MSSESTERIATHKILGGPSLFVDTRDGTLAVPKPLTQTNGDTGTMKSSILLELAKRWEEDAVEPQTQDGSPSAQEGNAIRKGERQAKRECADALRMLVGLLGERNE